MGSGLQLGDDLTAELAQLPEAAGVEVGQLGIVEAQKVEDRDVDVAQRVNHFYCLLSEFIGCADHMARVYACSGEPHRHGLRVVIAAPLRRATPNAVVGRPAELAAPDN